MTSPSQRQSDESVDPATVSKAVVSRLSLYLRELHHLTAERCETVSSGELGRRRGFTDAQVRKDLATFGPFGTPGVGYRTAELIDAIRRSNWNGSRSPL